MTSLTPAQAAAFAVLRDAEKPVIVTRGATDASVPQVNARAFSGLWSWGLVERYDRGYYARLSERGRRTAQAQIGLEP